MLRIQWTAHRTNISVLKQVHTDQRPFGIVLEKVVKYFGHLTRFEAGLERVIIQGRVEGCQCSSPTRWTDQIREKKVGTCLHVAAVYVRNRSRWRVVIK